MDAETNPDGRRWECTRCGARQVIVFPFHGVDNGGPLVCPPCAIAIEDSFRKERDNLLWAYGLGSGATRSRAGDTELSLELLVEVLALTHPDAHPPERAERAHRVTAALTALKPYLRPARKPATPEPSRAGGKQASRPKLPTYPCVRCMAYPPEYYCKACRTEWDKREGGERERRRRAYAARDDASVCGSCGKSLSATDPIWRQWACNMIVATCRDCKSDWRYFDQGDCGGCGRPVHTECDRRYRRHVYCSKQCERTIYVQVARARQAERRGVRDCSVCGEAFEPARSDSLYCGGPCRQKAYRRRVTDAKNDVSAAFDSRNVSASSSDAPAHEAAA